jgi:hypothetical protein
MELCSVAGFGVCGVESAGFATTVLDARFCLFAFLRIWNTK